MPVDLWFPTWGIVLPGDVFCQYLPTAGAGCVLTRCSGQGPHLAMTGEPRGFSRVAAGFSSYVGDFRLPLVLAQGSRWNNLEPEQCGQGGYTCCERGQTQCG